MNADPKWLNNKSPGTLAPEQVFDALAKETTGVNGGSSNQIEPRSWQFHEPRLISVPSYCHFIYYYLKHLMDGEHPKDGMYLGCESLFIV